MATDLASQIREELEDFRRAPIAAFPEVAEAIRAVLDIHESVNLGSRRACDVCGEISFGDWRAMDYPCPTVVAVGSALGLTEVSGGDA